MKLLLVRHPAPDIGTGICYGRLDLPLRSDAASSVAAIAEAARSHGVGAVLTSPAMRCLVPARQAAAAARAQLRIDDRLQELNFGDWEGMRWADVPRSELDRWAAEPLGFAPPGGETGLALLTRVRAVHQSLIAAGVDCVVISHGGPLRLLLAMARGMPPDLLSPPPPFGSVTAVTC